MIPRETPTLTAEQEWARAQVDGLFSNDSGKKKRGRRTPKKMRGVYYRRDRDSWWIRFADSNGKIRREMGGSRPTAVDLLRRRKDEVLRGVKFPESLRKKHGASVSEIFEDYTDTLKANGRDKRAQATTRLDEVAGLLGNVPADSLTPQDVEKLKARLVQTPARGRTDTAGNARPRTPASVNRYLQDMRAAFNLAKRNGKVDRNPVADVRLLRENNKRVREMAPDEEKAILAALDPSQKRTKAGVQDKRFRTDLGPMVRFLTETGLRLGEACNLCGNDVDQTAGVVTLRKTKAGKVQHIPLSAKALAILKTHGLPDGDAYVFAWPDGRPWTPGYVTHAFRDAAEDAGISDLRVHDLRHTFASRLVRAGVDIFAVSKLLRHASVTMSERYAHLSQNDLRAAVERLAVAQTDTTTSTEK